VKLTQIIIPVLEELKVKSIISLGIPGQKITAKKGNCEVHTWLSSQERQECMKNAKLVIFSGGHITCFETIKYAKPSICIPTQPEQMGNAAKLQNLRCSITVKNKKELEAAVQKIQENGSLFKRNVTALNAFSKKFKGLERAAEIIESVAK
jgi:UDP:flavonoid glycosyltransferase YjiC (YdhE family)